MPPKAKGKAKAKAAASSQLESLAELRPDPEDKKLAIEGATFEPATGDLLRSEYKTLADSFQRDGTVRLPDMVNKGMREGEAIPAGIRLWEDGKGKGWIADTPRRQGSKSKRSKWFAVGTWGSWRFAFLLARLQRLVWEKSPVAEVAEREAEASLLLNSLHDDDSNARVVALWAIVGSKALAASAKTAAITELAENEPVEAVRDAIKEAIRAIDKASVPEDKPRQTSADVVRGINKRITNKSPEMVVESTGEAPDPEQHTEPKRKRGRPPKAKPQTSPQLDAEVSGDEWLHEPKEDAETGAGVRASSSSSSGSNQIDMNRGSARIACSAAETCPERSAAKFGDPVTQAEEAAATLPSATKPRTGETPNAAHAGATVRPPRWLDAKYGSAGARTDTGSGVPAAAPTQSNQPASRTRPMSEREGAATAGPPHKRPRTGDAFAGATEVGQKVSFGAAPIKWPENKVGLLQLDRKALAEMILSKGWPGIISPRWEGERWHSILTQIFDKTLTREQIVEQIWSKLQRISQHNQRLQYLRKQAQKSMPEVKLPPRPQVPPRWMPPPGCTCGCPTHSERCKLFAGSNANKFFESMGSNRQRPHAEARSSGSSGNGPSSDPLLRAASDTLSPWARQQVTEIIMEIRKLPRERQRGALKQKMRPFHPDKQQSEDNQFAERGSEEVLAVFREIKMYYDRLSAQLS